MHVNRGDDSTPDDTMVNSKETPFLPQSIEDNSRVIEALERSQRDKRRKGFSCKKTTFKVQDSPTGIQVDSWRLQDWDYKKPGLPTYARGLFTTRNSKNQPEIAVRGYDKFFNVDEVQETKWDIIMSRTKPPYELTLKENGCIIFFAGLEDNTLLVCSKHSTGDRSDIQISHASAGERRLEEQLATLGKSRADFARELRARNVTAVAELCDDDFEEHILGYGPDKSGLYLHGINLNRPDFTTYPSYLVQNFAEDWGFRKTGLIVMDDIQSVRSFLEGVAQSGAHNGRDVEGFVIRCKVTRDPDAGLYHDWFFKYKFDEPYLMYRQWRECTKALIAGKEPKFKKHAAITQEYLAFARKRLAGDPNLAKLYSQNHGIIALRDEFLKFKNLRGSDAANIGDIDDELRDQPVMTEVTKNIVLCPIATIGCGKTTIALSLTHLFDWGHIQNDDISGKGRPPRFTKAILDELDVHPLVFADRNNAQRHERKQILTDLKRQLPTVRVVCLNFRHDESTINETRRIAQQRVIDRGDNHQTIHAATDQAKYLAVMEGFIKRFEPCNIFARPDDEFDVVIDLNPAAGSRENLEIVVEQLHKIFPKLIQDPPSSQQLNAAFEYALAFKPNFKHTIPDRTIPERKKAKKPQLEYMSADVSSAEVTAALANAFIKSNADTSKFYKQLKQTRRIQSKFHLTLMHRAMSKEHPELWQRYTERFEAAGGTEAKLGEVGVMLERVRTSTDVYSGACKSQRS